VLAVPMGREASHTIFSWHHITFSGSWTGAQAATTSSYASHVQRTPESRFSVTLDQEREIELTLV
jgi:hypothetical protein